MNWLNLYKALKQLSADYDPYSQPQHEDTSFCIHLLLRILAVIRDHPHLHNDKVDNSKWDYIVKFWGPVTERLFSQTKFRLKWGDTHITVSDILLKADLRILRSEIRPRYKVETDFGAFEAAEEEPEDFKYTSGRCKVLIESKDIIDKFVLDGCLIDSVDSLQLCGLKIRFGNTTLAKPGLYVGDEFYTYTVDNTLDNICKYFDLARYLLCFRDQCVAISNQYEAHLAYSSFRRIASKRSNCDLPEDNLVRKQSSVRGSWNPPRTKKTTPPPPPKNLFGSAE